MTPSKTTGRTSTYPIAHPGQNPSRHRGGPALLGEGQLGADHGRQHGERVSEVSDPGESGGPDLRLGLDDEELAAAPERSEAERLGLRLRG